MSHKTAGAGSPQLFLCARSRRLNERGHIVTLTGRTKPYKPPSGSSLGARSTLTSREYECSCGHVGWSNHVALERMEGRDA